MPPAETTPISPEEQNVLTKLEEAVGKDVLYSKLSPTFCLQAVRGWETENPRIPETIKNVLNIIAFRDRSNCKLKTKLKKMSTGRQFDRVENVLTLKSYAFSS